MRAQDKIVFSEAAMRFNCWILVRLTNPASLKYIGKKGYLPKRIDCKAKTADLDTRPFELAGLVVDPTVHANAFKPEKLESARESWEPMRNLIGKKYTVDMERKSKHFGCVQFEGNYIHGDYDLYDVVDMSDPHRTRANLALVDEMYGQDHRRGWLVLPIQRYVNARIGVDMVQHGGEAQYKEHSEQPLHAFGPLGEQFTLLNKYSVEHFYETELLGRQPLG
jgi:hypothetical protein